MIFWFELLQYWDYPQTSLIVALKLLGDFRLKCKASDEIPSKIDKNC